MKIQQGVMWMLILTVSLLCWRSEGTVTCRDNNNVSVDWYILYKAPMLNNIHLTGVEYLYINSTGVTKMTNGINDTDGILANTLRPLFTSIRSMSENFGFISYSDQPPGCSANPDKFGHSKGVLMVEKNRTGVWLLHSTPQFPFRRDQNHFWPNSGKKKAQTFICVTFPYDQFKHIGKHLQYIGAFPFEHDVPDDFHKELRDAANWVQSTPPTNFQPLQSSKGKVFHSIAKQQSPQAKVGDLYVTIAQLVSSRVDVQTWGCQKGRNSSDCDEVMNVHTIKTVMGNWSATSDHSKWCVARDQNKHWTCIADVNRATTQYERRGGALCLQDEEIQKIFLDFVGDTEKPTQNTGQNTKRKGTGGPPGHSNAKRQRG